MQDVRTPYEEMTWQEMKSWQKVIQRKPSLGNRVSTFAQRGCDICRFITTLSEISYSVQPKSLREVDWPHFISIRKHVYRTGHGVR